MYGRKELSIRAMNSDVEKLKFSIVFDFTRKLNNGVFVVLIGKKGLQMVSSTKLIINVSFIKQGFKMRGTIFEPYFFME